MPRIITINIHNIFIFVLLLQNTAITRAMLRQPTPLRGIPFNVVTEIERSRLEQAYAPITQGKSSDADTSDSGYDSDYEIDAIHDEILSNFYRNTDAAQSQSPRTIFTTANEDVENALKQPDVSSDHLKRKLEKQIANLHQSPDSSIGKHHRLLACEIRLRLLKIDEQQKLIQKSGADHK